MQTEHRHSHYHGCAGHSHGPEVFYGYCHETGRMRMMNYPDYVSNVQTGLSNMYQGVTPAMQPMLDAMTSWMRGPSAPSPHGHGYECGCHEHHRHGHDCGCGCHKHGWHHHDCHHEHHCHCHIRCADVVEYVRCGEVRRIPITFDNDTRRERDVTLQLGGFATESGQQIGWEAAVSETTFKLPPCGEKTVVLSVAVDCSKFAQQQPTPQPAPAPQPTPAGSQAPPNAAPAPAATEVRAPATVDSCKVAYATLRAEGCTIRPLVIAVAVLPESCGAHEASCGCGCCCH